MDKYLVKFWIKRFLQVFVGTAIFLGLMQFIESGSEIFRLDYVLTWSFITGVLASSISSYWAYKKKCKVVYKE